MLRGSGRSGLGLSAAAASSLAAGASGCGMSRSERGPDDGSALGVPEPGAAAGPDMAGLGWIGAGAGGRNSTGPQPARLLIKHHPPRPAPAATAR